MNFYFMYYENHMTVYPVVDCDYMDSYLTSVDKGNKNHNNGLVVGGT